MKKVFGLKKNQTRVYLENGRQLPVTAVAVLSAVVTQIKTAEKDGYNALQLALGSKRRPKMNKPTSTHLKKAEVTSAPLYLREVKVDNPAEYQLGQTIDAFSILKKGDQVRVAGMSKGRGFTGVVKRWGFAGGPKTHGQSDRQRAPGSIGQGTTPGRVFKGKHMAGRSGGERVMIKGLTVVDYDQETKILLLKGLIPGVSKGLVEIEKTGTDTRFSPVLKAGAQLKIEVDASAQKAKAKAEKEESPAAEKTPAPNRPVEENQHEG